MTSATRSPGAQRATPSAQRASRPRGRKLIIHRKPTPVGYPTPRALRAVVCCLDTARNTGVALYVAGKLYSYSEVDARNPDARRRVLYDAETAAKVRDMPLGVVLEVPWGGYGNAALSLHATVTLWRDTWRMMRVQGAVVEHTSGDWRRALFGKGGRSLARNAARALEARLAEQVACRDLPQLRHTRIGGDAAAAICIGQVMVRSSELQRALQCEVIR